MTENLTQIEHLLTLFEKREQILKYSTYEIFDLLKPTVLDALCELFELPFKEVQWGDVEYAEGIVVIVCTIWYNPETASPFLQEVFKQNNIPIQHPKYIRIGFPISHAFKPKEEIIDFLLHTPPFSKDSVDIPNRIKNNQVKFDTSNLTDEQLLQLHMYNNQGKGVKH